ncbi:hypothetical protein BV898_17001 [Hypsibius exemplaris]|uniref:Uncharacterized protein n=1 Tax=Hypsibius exemplaris TaxID=2072580 RepID=A0A9X6RLQ6_HYPEX|nr:hypothetical protein BV898_17001 [Hypsibius exemplaris]
MPPSNYGSSSFSILYYCSGGVISREFFIGRSTRKQYRLHLPWWILEGKLLKFKRPLQAVPCYRSFIRNVCGDRTKRRSSF